MSYARFFRGESDVYVYADVAGGITCCWCALGDTITFVTSGEMIQHLTEHRAKGNLVPDHTFDQILEDYPKANALIKGSK